MFCVVQIIQFDQNCAPIGLMYYVAEGDHSITPIPPVCSSAACKLACKALESLNFHIIMGYAQCHFGSFMINGLLYP